MINGVIAGGWAVNGQIVILNETGKEGMLRTLTTYKDGFTNQKIDIKLEIDDLVLYNGASGSLIGSGGYQSHGVPIGIKEPEQGRLLNIPFTKSLKITLINKSTGATGYEIGYSADYVIDIKQVVA